MAGSLNINFATPGQMQSGSVTNAALNPATLQQIVTGSALAFGYQLGPLSANALSATNCEIQTCQVINVSAGRLSVATANASLLSAININVTGSASTSAVSVTAANIARLSADALLGNFYYVKNQGLRNREIARYDRVFNDSVSVTRTTSPNNASTYLITGKVTFTPSVCCIALDITVGHHTKSNLTHNYLNLNTTQWYLASSYNNNFNVGDNTSTANFNTNGWNQFTDFKYGTHFLYMENCAGNWQYQTKDAYRFRWNIKSVSGLSANSTISLYTYGFVGGYYYPTTLYADRTLISVREILAYE